MPVQEQYGYALQLLEERNIKVYGDEKKEQRILKKNRSYLFKNLKPPETSIYTSDHILRAEIKPVSITYAELLDYGYKIGMNIVNYHSRDQSFRTEFVLVKIGSPKKDYGAIPPDHQVMLNTNDYQVRLEGPRVIHFVGEWHDIKDYRINRLQSQKKTEKTLVNQTIDKSNEIFELISGNSIATRLIKMNVDEVPAIVTDDGDLICIPEEDDPPTICVCGERGSGKSLLQHRICDITYWRWGTKNIIMNDINAETVFWAKPWHKKSRNIKLKYQQNIKTFSEHPMPLPIIYLHPENNPSITFDRIYHRYETGIKISLPFKNFIHDFENTLKGIPNWELGKSGVRFRNMIQSMGDQINYTDFERFKEAISFYYEGLRYQGENHMKSIQEKIMAIMNDLNNANFLDISNQVPSRWTAEKGDYETYTDYPWAVCMKYDLIPSILTSFIRNKKWFPQYYRFINDSIIDNQLRNPAFRDSVVIQFIDELGGIVDSKKPTLANESVEKVFAEGRNLRLGAVYGTQNYERVPDKIRQNTHYTFIFRQKAKESVSMLKSDFPDLRVQSRGGYGMQIQQLKPLECVAVGTRPFKCYKITGEEYESVGPIRGRIIMPLSSHKGPKDKL